MNLRPIITACLGFTCAVAIAATPTTTPAAPGTTVKSPAPAAPAATTPSTPASDIIHVGGSDMLQTAVGEPLTRYLQQQPNLKAKVDLQGSVLALSGLKSGKVQVAIIAAPVGQIPAPAEFKTVLFCYQADYIIVNQDNPLKALDLNQAASVFGTTQQAYTIWGQLQLTAEWADRPIIAYSTSTDDGVVVELFKNIALKGSALKGTVRVANSPQEMLKNIASNPNAIGLGGFDPADPGKVKVLLLANPNTSTNAVGNAGRDAVAATPDNVFNGSYPLRLPYYLVYNPADKARVLPILQLLLSPDYAGFLLKEHFIPLSDTERNRALLELDKPN